MKTHFDGFRVVTELTDNDVIDIISCYEFADETDTDTNYLDIAISLEDMAKKLEVDE